MNDLIELLFCPQHGALGWLLACWPCVENFSFFLLTVCNNMLKVATNREEKQNEL